MFSLFIPYQGRIFEIADSDQYDVNDTLIITDDEGKLQYGTIIKKNDKKGDGETKLFTIKRKATSNDLQKLELMKKDEKKDIELAQGKAELHDLPMIFREVIYSLDAKKITFVFMADERIDFRDLVKDLIAHYRRGVHLQQIGPRDQARSIGGFGKCGRKLCCSSHLKKLEPVTLDHARAQGMVSKGAGKLSGSCGKLMCCLRYEAPQYKEMSKDFPRINAEVEVISEKKSGKVIGLDVINNKVNILLKNGEQKFIKNVELEDVKWKKNK